MTLDYKNIKINYEKKGKGPAVVLLHGFLENLNMWDTILPVLSKNHLIINIDLLGHGKTGSLGYIHTMEDMAEAVIAVLDHHEINTAYFAGHSMGGYVALALAEKDPHRINSLCLINSTFEADDTERKKIRKRAIKMAHTNYESLVSLSFSNLFVIESKLKFKKEYNTALKQALKTTVQGYIAAQEGMTLRPNRFEIFKNIKGKTLVVTGKKDTLINSMKIKKQIEETFIIHKELPGGHMSHIESFSELTYILKRFIEK